MSKSIIKTLIAAKVEAVAGTDIVPGAADCIVVRNPNLTPLEMSYAERNIVRGFFGNTEKVVTFRKVKVSFEVEYQGSGTAGTAPAYDGLLQACGASSTVVAVTSVTWAPLSGTGKTLSIYYNVDGVLHKMVWARGNCEVRIKSNDIPVLYMEFIALDTGATDTAMLNPSSFGSYITAFAATKANTPTANLFGAAVALESLTLNFGNVNQQISRIGNEQILHTDRKSVGQIMIEMTAIATKDWLLQVKNATLGAVQVVHGAVGGKIMTLNAANTQLMNPSFSNIQGIEMIQFQVAYMPSNAGNDEWSIVNT